MRVEIVPGTLRDLSFIATNLRPQDQREIYCQLPEGITPAEIAVLSMMGRTWVAVLDGQPIAAFGIVPIAASVLSLWCWGTPRMTRAVPAITRYVRDELAPEWARLGVTRVEARSIAGHDAAHRWLRGQGFSSVPCPSYGRGCEDFLLFAITRRDWDVLQRPGNAELGSERPAVPGTQP